MTQIAQAVRAGREVPSAVFTGLQLAARREPLAPEPFLVRGVQAQLAGDTLIAQRAFQAAQWRDPRSLPAAYFLADRYVRADDLDRGLRQIAALARLSPGGARAAGPYFAAFAASRQNWPALRRVFRTNPQLAEPALVALAGDLATIPAVLALADPRTSGPQASWLAPLLETLVEAGQYDRARSIWAQASRATPGALLHDAEFRDKVSPPPFNWSLTSSSVGLAERQPPGRLHVLFYGQEDGILATQLLLLAPGSYRLSMRLLGDPASGQHLTWSIWCDKAAAPVASVTLAQVAARGWQFAVPAGCRAQWLRLSGSSGDLAQQADVVIGALKLEPVSGA
jgi:hypothetical protein